MPRAMKLANSVSVPLPRMIAPACRSLRAMKASFSGIEPPRATEPAVVGMSLVAMLSLRITGMPKSERPRQVRPIQRGDAREVHAHQMLGTEDAGPVCGLDVSDGGLTQLKLRGAV